MVKKQFLYILIACVFGILHNQVMAQPPSFIQNELNAYITDGMKDWQVPALALVIVKDGEVVKMQGYGVRDVTTRETVDEHTLFYIASNSKLFTGSALANLAYQRRISLDDKVTKYFPDFKLYDDLATKQVSIRDMLTHRIGTKTFQGDFTFWNSTLSSAEIMQKMRLLQPTQIFRQDYGYCNSCFLTAGEVIPKVTNMSWGKYIQDSLLQPLGMNESIALSNHVHKQQTNMAVPYNTAYTGELKQVPYDQWDNLGPAASIVSNVSDLSHWIMMQLDSGRYNGKQILPWPVVRQTRQVNIITNSNKSPLFPMHFRGYGLGLNVADYNGRQIYWHTGGAAGMVSNVCFVPEENLGIAVLSTNDNQSFFEALRYQILDAYLGVPFVNRSEQLLPGHKEEMSAQLNEIKQWKARLKNNRPPLPLNAYTGHYQNALYGDIKIIPHNNNTLRVTLPLHPDMYATLTFLDGDEWMVEYSNIEYGIFTTRFTTNNAKVVSLSLPVNPFIEMDPYIFIKK